jgi:hypothetical protein
MRFQYPESTNPSLSLSSITESSKVGIRRRLFAIIRRVLRSHLRCSNAVRKGQKYLLDCTITDVLSVTKTSAVPGLRPTQPERNC